MNLNIIRLFIVHKQRNHHNMFNYAEDITLFSQIHLKAIHVLSACNINDSSGLLLYCVMSLCCWSVFIFNTLTSIPVVSSLFPLLTLKRE